VKRALAVVLAASLCAPASAAELALVETAPAISVGVAPAAAPAALSAPRLFSSPALSAPLAAPLPVSAPSLRAFAAPAAAVSAPRAAASAEPPAPIFVPGAAAPEAVPAAPVQAAAAPAASAAEPALPARAGAAVGGARALAAAFAAPAPDLRAALGVAFDGAAARRMSGAAGAEELGSRASPRSALEPAASPASPRGHVVVAEAAQPAPGRRQAARAYARAGLVVAGAIAVPLAAVLLGPALFLPAAAWAGLAGMAAGEALFRSWGLERDKGGKDLTPVYRAASIAAVGLSGAGLAIASPVTAAIFVAAIALESARSAGLLSPLSPRWSRADAGPAPLFRLAGPADRARIEIGAEQFGRLYLMSASLERGLGESHVFAGMIDGHDRVVYLKRSGDFVELVARATSARAAPGSPLERAVRDSTTDSTIAKARVLAENSATGAVSVPAAELFMADLFRWKPELEHAYGGDYSLDDDLSAVQSARAYPRNLEVSVRQVYERDEKSSGSGERTWRLPDTGRLPLSVRFSLAALPAAGYRPRRADPRVGLFETMYRDWSDDRRGLIDKVLVSRWRLEKEDPSAAASRVKSPIVFWIDPSVPPHYRAAVSRGVLAWNKAFERIGLLGALEVRQAPDDGTFDSADARRNVIRWFVDKDAGYAVGQSRVNPLTGEIYQATLAVSAGHPVSAEGGLFRALGEGPEASFDKPCTGGRCEHAAGAARQAQMTMSVIETRGGMSDAEKDRFVQDYIVDLALHEVGHTLGLRHNFLAKLWKGGAELSGEAPLAASVMDYLPANIAAPGEKQGSYWNTDIGPYDYWAIEYAYSTLDGMNAQQEEQALRRIAERATEPGLAYATDEDLIGLDPDSRPWHIGGDALAFARGRIATVRELWTALEKKQLAPDESPSSIYRAFVNGWRAYLEAERLTSEVVFGMSYRRRVGAGDSFAPISGTRRREALKLLDARIFSDEAFAAGPGLRRRLVPGREPTVDAGWAPLEFHSYDEMVDWLREDALNRVLDADLIRRLDDAAAMADPGDRPLRPRELIDTVTRSIWREALSPGRGRRLTISPARRRLQEFHLRRLIELAAYPKEDEDVPVLSTLARAHLKRLGEKLQAKLARPWDLESRDHLRQSIERIRKAHDAESDE
jgi:hypothetical protein